MDFIIFFTHTHTYIYTLLHSFPTRTHSIPVALILLLKRWTIICICHLVGSLLSSFPTVNLTSMRLLSVQMWECHFKTGSTSLLGLSLTQCFVKIVVARFTAEVWTWWLSCGSWGTESCSGLPPTGLNLSNPVTPLYFLQGNKLSFPLGFLIHFLTPTWCLMKFQRNILPCFSHLSHSCLLSMPINSVSFLPIFQVLTL